MSAPRPPTVRRLFQDIYPKTYRWQSFPITLKTLSVCRLDIGAPFGQLCESSKAALLSSTNLAPSPDFLSNGFEPDRNERNTLRTFGNEVLFDSGHGVFKAFPGRLVPRLGSILAQSPIASTTPLTNEIMDRITPETMSPKPSIKRWRRPEPEELIQVYRKIAELAENDNVPRRHQIRKPSNGLPKRPHQQDFNRHADMKERRIHLSCAHLSMALTSETSFG